MFVWAVRQVQGHSAQLSETLSHKEKKKIEISFQLGVVTHSYSTSYSELRIEAQQFI